MSLYLAIEPDLHAVRRLLHAAETICPYGSEDADATGLNTSDVEALEEVLKGARHVVARVKRLARMT